MNPPPANPPPTGAPPTGRASLALSQRLARLGVARDARALGGLASRRAAVIGRVGDGQPLFGTDHSLARAWPGELVRGLAALGVLHGAERLVLAVRADLIDDLGPLRRRVAGTRVELATYPPRYPGERDDLLCDLAAGRLSSPLPHDGRCEVYGATTLRDAAAALERAPLPRRVVSVVGDLARPAVLEAPLGTPLLELARACGCADLGWVALHNGARPVAPDASVDLDTRGLLVLPVRHGLVVAATTPPDDLARRAASACVNCRVCTDVCPVHLAGGHLQPHRVVQLAARGWLAAPRPDARDALDALECRGCRVCELSCPARLEPGRLVREVGARLAEAGVTLDARRGYALAPRAEREGRRMGLERVAGQRGLAAYARPVERLERPLVPDRLAVALDPRAGARREPLVAPGARLTRGAPIAGDGDGLCLELPVDGRVAAVTDDEIVVDVA